MTPARGPLYSLSVFFILRSCVRSIFFVLSRRGIAEYGDLVRRFHFDRTRKLSSIYEGDGRSMGASFCDGTKLF